MNGARQSSFISDWRKTKTIGSQLEQDLLLVIQIQHKIIVCSFCTRPWKHRKRFWPLIVSPSGPTLFVILKEEQTWTVTTGEGGRWAPLGGVSSCNTPPRRAGGHQQEHNDEYRELHFLHLPLRTRSSLFSTRLDIESNHLDYHSSTGTNSKDSSSSI